MSSANSDPVFCPEYLNACDSKLWRSHIEDITIFAALEPQCLDQICVNFQLGSYPAHSKVFAAGSSPDYIYIVIQGEVRLSQMQNDVPITLATIHQGGCFGQVSAIGIQPRMCDAHTLIASDLLRIPTNSLHLLHKNNPDAFGVLMTNIARELCRRLAGANTLLLAQDESV